MVFYRKYRPQTIHDLDLASVREKLTSVLSSKELPHAFLFTGPKGLGKTSAARILAKAINCENKLRIENGELRIKGNKNSQLASHNSQLNIEPCNKCEACVSITNGSNIDVLEIDAASNGGVEEIRTLRERVKFMPSMLSKKVYIIDEVHMLSTGAFNALLKTLEEPPGHVVFILATTELHKLPQTIISRTFQINFEKPKESEMAQSLERIVKGEGLDVEKEVLEEVSKISDGAFRDAAKNLEELVFSSEGKKITLDLFYKVFRTGNVKEEVLQLLKSYEARDAKKALETIAGFIKNGTDFKLVIERLVDHLRGLLMMRNGIESDEADVAGLNISNIKELLELSNEAFSEMKVSVIPSLPLELMTVKYCILDRPNENLKMKNEKEGEESKNDERLMINDEKEDLKNEKLKAKNENDKSGEKDLLKELINRLNDVNKPGAALLRSAVSASILNGKIIIATPFPIHAERLKSEKVLPDLLKTGESIIGEKVEIEIKISPN